MHNLRSLLLVLFVSVIGSFVFAQTEATVSDQSVVTTDPSAGLSAGAREVIRLADSGKDKAAITEYVTNSQQPFQLNADDVIYLRDVGIDTEIVTAMLNHDVAQAGTAGNVPTPESAVPTAEAPLVPSADMTVASTAPAEVTPFYGALSPYGSWINIEGQGWAWQPNVVVSNPGWQPYCDSGHWLWTDCGWYWASDYSWGWAPFHYGRWWRSPNWSWVWFPGQQWAPSWVTWRTYGNDYCGWAPLPPHSGFIGGSLSFRDSFVGLSFDFGLPVDCFTFVEFPFFFNHDFRHHRLSHDRARQFFHRSSVVNNFATVNNNIVINNGVPVDRVRRSTGRSVRTIPVVDSTRVPRSNRGTEVMRNRSGETLAATRVPLDLAANQTPQPFVAQRLSGSAPIAPAVPRLLTGQQQSTTVNSTTERQQRRSSPTRSDLPSRTAVSPAPTDSQNGTERSSVPSGPPLWNGRRNVPADERQLWNGSNREQSLVLPSQRNSRGELPTPSSPSDIRDAAGAARTEPATEPSRPPLRETQPAPKPQRREVEPKESIAPSRRDTVPQTLTPDRNATPKIKQFDAPTETVIPRGLEAAPKAQLPRSGDVYVPPSGPVAPPSVPTISVPRASESVPQTHGPSRATPSADELRVPARTATPPQSQSAPSLPRFAPSAPIARPSPPAVSAPSFPTLQQRSVVAPSVSQGFRGPSQAFPSRAFSSPPSSAFRMPSAPSARSTPSARDGGTGSGLEKGRGRR
ncbi:MAG: hypothetical protein JWM68_2170 [Verrucomicrobiales bacterium]|nr:hypothetical protein [Verrucomicrobiales bacterium]